MKYFLSLAIMMLFAGAGLGQTALAQANIPQGSWQMSCSNARMHGSRLRARCRRDDDSWERSSIDVNRCPSGLIANINGQLACEGRTGERYGNWNNQLPSGSWSDSCRNASMRGNALSASCQDGSGAYRRSSLDVTLCPQTLISNENGRLSCQEDQR
jgi:hypothetical protein